MLTQGQVFKGESFWLDERNSFQDKHEVRFLLGEKLRNVFVEVSQISTYDYCFLHPGRFCLLLFKFVQCCFLFFIIKRFQHTTIVSYTQILRIPTWQRICLGTFKTKNHSQGRLSQWNVMRTVTKLVRFPGNNEGTGHHPGRWYHNQGVATLAEVLRGQAEVATRTNKNSKHPSIPTPTAQPRAV